jgi:magnesium transporter
MIILFKNNEVKKLDLISEIETDAKDLFNIRIIDFTDSTKGGSEKFGLDMSIFNQRKILK